MDTPTVLKFNHSTPTCLWRWNRQSVWKCRRIKFRHRGITQKKTYNMTPLVTAGFGCIVTYSIFTVCMNTERCEGQWSCQ